MVMKHPRKFKEDSSVDPLPQNKFGNKGEVPKQKSKKDLLSLGFQNPQRCCEL